VKSWTWWSPKGASDQARLRGSVNAIRQRAGGALDWRKKSSCYFNELCRQVNEKISNA
jgi:hypothetical protein